MSGRWSDAELLERLLNDAEQGVAGRAPLDGEARARLVELERFLATCRSALGEEGAAASTSALAERVLGRTTREDLSWRGDLRLVGTYVRDRLRGSLLLRVAAASLLVHVAALPVLAYLAFFSPEPRVRIGFVPWEEQYPPPIVVEDEAPPRPLPVPEVHEEPAVLEIPADDE